MILGEANDPLDARTPGNTCQQLRTAVPPVIGMKKRNIFFEIDR
jgi:hypothetical protein